MEEAPSPFPADDMDSLSCAHKSLTACRWRNRRQSCLYTLHFLKSRTRVTSLPALPLCPLLQTAGLAGARGRSGRGAPKRGAPGWGAGRCKISGALRFKTDHSDRDFEPAISCVLGCALRNCTSRQLLKFLKQSIYKQL